MKKIAILLLFAVFGCTDAKQSKITGFGKRYKVECLSGGIVVRTYTSSGKVSSEKNSDGYYFNDEATNKLVEISGDVIITEL
jgi:hypothetical protein